MTKPLDSITIPIERQKLILGQLGNISAIIIRAESQIAEDQQPDCGAVLKEIWQEMKFLEGYLWPEIEDVPF